jgi:E3 ubiquitin-protein ligase BOI-like protein
MTAGSNNPRKRAREVAASIGVSSSAPMNPIFSLQSQQAPQLIDLSQLHNNNHQPNVVSTGLRLSFGDQQQQRQQQLQHQQQQQQQQQQHVCHSSSPFLSVITEDYASQIKQQRDEIEQFLQAQVLIFLFALMVFFFFFFLSFGI